MKTIVAALIAVTIAGCATDPDFRSARRENLAIWQAEFIDAKRMCRASGGFMVQHPPEVGGRYRCVR